MNTLFSAGWGLWQTKPLVRVSPQPCPAAEQSPHCESGMQHLPGHCLGMGWDSDPGDKPCPLCSWHWHPTSPAESGTPAGLRGAFPVSQGMSVGGTRENINFSISVLIARQLLFLLLGPSSKKHLGRDFAMPVARRGPQ